MLSPNLGGATDRLSLLVVGRSVYPCFAVKTYFIKLLRSIMAEPMKDPLLGLVLTKLTAIEVSINELTRRVGVQNGRVGKLEQHNSEQKAIADRVKSDFDSSIDREDRKIKKFIGFVAAGATLLAAVVAEIVSRV